MGSYRARSGFGYHSQEVAKGDAFTLVFAHMREEFEKETDLLLLGGLEDLGCVTEHLPIPRMNSSSEMKLLSS